MQLAGMLSYCALIVTCGVASIVGVGCVGRRLNPVVEPVVASVTRGACALVPPGAAVGPAGGLQVDGEALCSLLAGILDGALKLFSATPFAADAGAESERAESQLRYRGEVIYRGSTQRAAYLFHRLAADGRFRADVDRILDDAGVAK